MTGRESIEFRRHAARGARSVEAEPASVHVCADPMYMPAVPCVMRCSIVFPLSGSLPCMNAPPNAIGCYMCSCPRNRGCCIRPDHHRLLRSNPGLRLQPPLSTWCRRWCRPHRPSEPLPSRLGFDDDVAQIIGGKQRAFPFGYFYRCCMVVLFVCGNRDRTLDISGDGDDDWRDNQGRSRATTHDGSRIDRVSAACSKRRS